MLNGIGGNTIQEAKDTLTVDEVDAWRLYRNMHGPMAVHIRLQEHLATVCSLIATAAGMKKQNGSALTSEDFLHYSKQEPSKPLDEITDFGEFLNAIK